MMEDYYIVMHPGDEPRPMQIIDGGPRLLEPDDVILQNGGPVTSGTGTSIRVVDENGMSIDGFMSTEPYYYLDDDGNCFEIPPGSICTGQEWDYSDDEEVAQEEEEEREMSDNIKSLSITHPSGSVYCSIPSSFSLPSSGTYKAPGSLLPASATITRDLPVPLSATGATGWSAQRNGSVEEYDAGGFGVDGEIYGTIISLPDTEDLPISYAQEMPSSSSQGPEFYNYVTSNAEENTNLPVSEAYVQYDASVEVTEQFIEEAPAIGAEHVYEYAPVTDAEHVEHAPDNDQAHLVASGHDVYSQQAVANNAAVVTEEVFSYAPDYGEDTIRDAPDVTVTDFIETELTEEISVGDDTVGDFYIPSSSTGTSEPFIPQSLGGRFFLAAHGALISSAHKPKKIKSLTVSTPISTTSSNYYNPLEIPETVLKPKILPPSKPIITSASKQGLKSPSLKTMTSLNKVSKSPQVLSHSPERKAPTSGRGRKTSLSETEKKINIPSEKKYIPDTKPPLMSEKKLSAAERKSLASEKKSSLLATSARLPMQSGSSKQLPTQSVSSKQLPTQSVSSKQLATQSVSSKQRNASLGPISAPTPLASPPRDPNVRASGRARRANSRFPTEEFEYTSDRIAHFSGSGGESESDTGVGRVVSQERVRKPSKYEEFQKLIADAKIFSDSQQSRDKSNTTETRRRRSSKKSEVSMEEFSSTVDAATIGTNMSTTSAVNISTSIGANSSMSNDVSAVHVANVDALNVNVATGNFEYSTSNIDNSEHYPSHEELVRYIQESCQDQTVDVMNLGEEVVVFEEMVVATSTGEQYFSEDQSSVGEGQFGVRLQEQLAVPSSEYFVDNKHSFINPRELTGQEETERLISENQLALSDQENKREGSILMPSLMPVASTSTESFVEVNVTDNSLAVDHTLNTSSNVSIMQPQRPVETTETLEDELVIDFTPPSKSVRGRQASGSAVKRGRGRQKRVSEEGSLSPTSFTAPVQSADLIFNSPPHTALDNETLNKSVLSETVGSPTPVKRGRGRPPKNLTRRNVMTVESEAIKSGSFPDVMPIMTDILPETSPMHMSDPPVSIFSPGQIQIDKSEWSHSAVNTGQEANLRASYLNVPSPAVHESSELIERPSMDNIPSASTFDVPVQGTLDPVALVHIPVLETTAVVDDVSSQRTDDTNVYLTSTFNVLTSPDTQKGGRRGRGYRKKSEVSTAKNPLSSAFDVSEQISLTTASDGSVVDKSIAAASKDIDWKQRDINFEKALAEVMNAPDLDNCPVSSYRVPCGTDAVLTTVFNAEADVSSGSGVERIEKTHQTNEDIILKEIEKEAELSLELTDELVVCDELQDEESKAVQNETDQVCVSTKSTPTIDFTSFNKLDKFQRESVRKELKIVDLFDVEKDLPDAEILTNVNVVSETVTGLPNVADDDVSTSVKKKRGRPPRKSIVPEAATSLPVEVEMKITTLTEQSSVKAAASNTKTASSPEKRGRAGGNRKRRRQSADERENETEKKLIILSHAEKIDEERGESSLKNISVSTQSVSIEPATENEAKQAKLDVMEYTEPEAEDVVESAIISMPPKLVSFTVDTLDTMRPEDVDTDKRDSYVTTQDESRSRFTAALSDREESCDSFASSRAEENSDDIGQSLDIEAMLSTGFIVDPVSVLNAIKANEKECTILEHRNKSLRDALDALSRKTGSNKSSSNKNESGYVERQNKSLRSAAACDNLNEAFELFVCCARTVSYVADKKRETIEKEYNARWRELIKRENKLAEEILLSKNLEAAERRVTHKLRKELENDLTKWEKLKAKQLIRKKKEKRLRDASSERMQSRQKSHGEEGNGLDVERTEGTKLSNKALKRKEEASKRSPSNSKHTRDKSSEKHSNKRRRELSPSPEVRHESKKFNRGISETSAKHRDGQSSSSAGSSRDWHGSSASGQGGGMSSSGKYDDEKTKRKNLAGIRALQSKILMRAQRVESKESVSEELSETETGCDVTRNEGGEKGCDVSRNEGRHGMEQTDMCVEEPLDETKPEKAVDSNQPTVNTSASGELIGVDQSHYASSNNDEMTISKPDNLNEDLSGSQSLSPITVEAKADVSSVTDSGIKDASNNILNTAVMSPRKTIAPEDSVSSATLLSTNDVCIAEKTVDIVGPHMENTDDIEVSFRTGGMSP